MPDVAEKQHGEGFRHKGRCRVAGQMTFGSSAAARLWVLIYCKRGKLCTHRDYMSFGTQAMSAPISCQIDSQELTGDGSFDGERFEPHVQSLPIKESGYSIIKRYRLPLTHVFVLSSITVIGFILSHLFSSAFQSDSHANNRLLHFLRANISTFVVGFGFAIYGCLVNRSTRRTFRTRENLGPYRLLRLIGSGGMGEVYLAEHELLKRRCAVKLIRSDKAANRKMLARFEREVKATAQLTHWNTVQVFDYGCTSTGTFYYSMEYLQGLNLRQLVEEHGPLPPGRVIYILRQLCGALHEAAMFGLVHRDIKPSNIFLTERGQVFDVVKLLDFGLVRPASFGTCPIQNVSRQLQGSPRFMCPEQAQGQKPDCRGDLYSLACVAYFLLTGRAPFEDDNPIMLVVAHAKTPAPTFAEVGVTVPDDLSAAIMRCLAKDPEERFQRPREFLEALDKCRAGSEWSWQDAEDWWLDHPDETHHQLGEQGSSGSEATPTESAVLSEPDATFVCHNPATDDSIC